jgi:excisionase family DNA binding protein
MAGTQFISIEAAADQLGVCTRTVRRMIAEGDLPGYRLKRAIRVRESDLEAAMRPIPTVGASYG